MALDRRTLRAIVEAPLVGADDHTTFLLMVSGASSRSVLHVLGVRLPGARRVSPRHLIVPIADGGTAHVVAVAEDEGEHPVTRQLALRAQVLLAASDVPRPCRSLPVIRVADPCDAFAEAIRVAQASLERSTPTTPLVPDESGVVTVPAPDESDVCDVAMLGVVRLTAQELLTALDRVMSRSGLRRVRHAGGGRDFLLIRGERGAALRIADDRLGSATDLAVQLARVLRRAVLVATGTGAPTDEGHELSWDVESVTTSGTAVAYRDHALTRTVAGALDDHLCHHIADQVFDIHPAPTALPLHYEDRAHDVAG